MAGVSPNVTCHFCLPESRSMAVMVPYGGLINGNEVGGVWSPASESGSAVTPNALPVRSTVYSKPMVSLGTPFLMRYSTGLSVPFTYNVRVSGSNAVLPHPAPPIAPGITIVPCSDGGVNTGPLRYFRKISSARRCNSGVKSMRSLSLTCCRAKAAGKLGIGCVGEARSPGTSLAGTGRSVMGQIGLPVTRSNTYSHAVLDGTTTTSRGRPFHCIVASTGGAGRS